MSPSLTPTISGSLVLGDLLSVPGLPGVPTVEQVQCSTGVFDGNPTSFTFQWFRRLTVAGTWSSIGGATRSDYIIDASETAYSLKCQVTATNAGGSSAAVDSDVHVVAVGGATGPSLPGFPLTVATPDSRTATNATVGSLTLTAA